MAKKSFKQKFGLTKTQQQTHRFLYFTLSHTGNGEDFHYIDLAKKMSAVNSRLYRQGMCYHVANVSIHDSQGDASVKFATAPNTWATYRAWKYMFDAWKRQRAEVLKDTPLSSPTWSDFKVYLNKDHVSDPDWPQVKNVENQNVLGGQWDYADMTFHRANIQFDNHAVGLLGPNDFNSSIGSSTSVDDAAYDSYISAITTLDDNRRAISKDELATADNYGDSRDALAFVSFNLATPESNLDILNELDDEGIRPPYSYSIVGTGTNPASGNDAFTVREAHIGSGGAPMAMVGGFPVPCGLIQIETKASGDNTIGICIELVPGSYKGVHAIPMGE